MPVLIVYNHGKKAKPIGRVISVEMVNGSWVVVWRKKTDTIQRAMINISWSSVAYLCLALIFGWWPL
jgi:hypothetical protein